MNYIYCHPEDFELEVVDEIDYSSGSYEFDTRIVWKHIKTGKHYTARDSGCSCPLPFEDYTTIEDLEEIGTIDSLKTEINKELNEDYKYITVKDGNEFLNNVKKSLEVAR